MRLCSCAVTDPGRGGRGNEDACLADDARGLYVVSDGVGTYRGAASASRWAVEEAARALDGGPPDPAGGRDWLRRAARAANARLVHEAQRDRSIELASATLTLLHFAGPDFAVLHVGDSRAYRFADERLVQMTADHSVAFEQYLAGAIPKEDLASHPNQKLLTRTLSAARDFVVPDVVEGRAAPGDRYLVCTDGLTKELSDAEIAGMLARIERPEALAPALVEAANGRGGRDNVTVIVVAVED